MEHLTRRLKALLCSVRNCSRRAYSKRLMLLEQFIIISLDCTQMLLRCALTKLFPQCRLHICQSIDHFAQQVIASLAARSRHVPYRNHLLTEVRKANPGT